MTLSMVGILLRVELFDEDDVAFGDAVLFSSGFDYCVHFNPLFLKVSLTKAAPAMGTLNQAFYMRQHLF